MAYLSGCRGFLTGEEKEKKIWNKTMQENIPSIMDFLYDYSAEQAEYTACLNLLRNIERLSG